MLVSFEIYIFAFNKQEYIYYSHLNKTVYICIKSNKILKDDFLLFLTSSSYYVRNIKFVQIRIELCDASRNEPLLNAVD